MIHDINHAKFDQLPKITDQSFMTSQLFMLASPAGYPCRKSSNLSLSGSPAWLSCLVEDFHSSRGKSIYLSICAVQFFSEKGVNLRKFGYSLSFLPFPLIMFFLGIVLVWFSISLI